MKTAYILGAGASNHAGFPLASGLPTFLRREWGKTANLTLRKDGGFFFDCYDSFEDLRILSGVESFGTVLDAMAMDAEARAARIPPQLRCDLEQVLDRWSGRPSSGHRAATACATLITHAFKLQSDFVRDQLFHSNDSASGPREEALSRVAGQWADSVASGDCIVTFNWDLFNELALWRAEKWHYSDGYGIRLHAEIPRTAPVKIFKLHGSINWALANGIVNRGLWLDDLAFYFDGIADQDYHTQRRPPGVTSARGPSLVTPSYLKNTTAIRELDQVWSKARSALASARAVVVIGYSLPEADQNAVEMITSALAENDALQEITVVLKSDRQAFARWKKLAERAGKRTLCLSETFESYVDHRVSSS